MQAPVSRFTEADSDLSLDLVRTYDADLKNLIHLRNLHSELLKNHSGACDRIDNTIRAARLSLENVYKLVESCRPGAHGGKVPLKNRLRWALRDSREFRDQKSILVQHNNDVLNLTSYVTDVAEMSASERRAEMEKREEALLESRSIHSSRYGFEDASIGRSSFASASHKLVTAISIASLASDDIAASTPGSDGRASIASGHSSLHTPLPQRPRSEWHSPNSFSEVRKSASDYFCPPPTAPVRGYSDEKEVVVPVKDSRRQDGCVVLGSIDSGLSTLFGGTSTDRPAPRISPLPSMSSLKPLSSEFL